MPAPPLHAQVTGCYVDATDRLGRLPPTEGANHVEQRVGWFMRRFDYLPRLQRVCILRLSQPLT